MERFQTDTLVFSFNKHGVVLLVWYEMIHRKEWNESNENIVIIGKW